MHPVIVVGKAIKIKKENKYVVIFLFYTGMSVIQNCTFVDLDTGTLPKFHHSNSHVIGQ